MAQQQAPRRRIQPQLISPSQAAVAAANFLKAATAASKAQAPVVAEHRLSLKEESAYTAQHLGPGRRIYVDLADKLGDHINWKKLLRENGVDQNAAAAKPVEAGKEADLPPMPGMPAAPPPPRHEASNLLNSVIQRLEQQYQMHDEDDSEEDDDEPVVKSRSSKREGSPQSDESGAREKNEDYDYDDDFIDDSEFLEFVGGDRRKLKHSGFFINKGEIEKTGEAKRDSPPVKKRKKKHPADNGTADASKRASPPAAAKEAKPAARKKRPKDSETADAAGPPVKKMKQTKLVTKPTADSTQAAAKAQPVAGPSAPQSRPATSTQASLAEEAAAAGMLASGGLPIRQDGTAASSFLGAAQRGEAYPGASSPTALLTSQPSASLPASTQKQTRETGPVYTMPEQVQAALMSIGELAEATKAEQQQAPTTGIPKHINAQLIPIACLLAREGHSHPGARQAILEKLVEMFAPLYPQHKLAKRLDSLAKSATEDLAATTLRLRESIKHKLEAWESWGSASLPAAESFLWDKNIDNLLHNFVLQHIKVHGGQAEGPESSRAFSDLLSLWPPGKMVDSILRDAFKRAKQAPRAAAALKGRKSMDASEAAAVAVASGGVREAPNASGPTQSAAASVWKPSTSLPTRESSLPTVGGLPPLPPAASTAILPISAPGGVPTSQPAIVAHDPPEPASLSQLSRGASEQPSQPAVAVTQTHESLPPAGVATADPIEAAMILGANPNILTESLSKVTAGTAKATINKVLMFAGATGYTTQEIVDKANALKLTGDQPWDANKKTYITSCIRSSDYNVHIGRYRYAHLAFPGVAEAAQKELEHKLKLREATVAENQKKVERKSPDADHAPANGAAPAALPVSSSEQAQTAAVTFPAPATIHLKPTQQSQQQQQQQQQQLSSVPIQVWMPQATQASGQPIN